MPGVMSLLMSDGVMAVQTRPWSQLKVGKLPRVWAATSGSATPSASSRWATAAAAAWEQ